MHGAILTHSEASPGLDARPLAALAGLVVVARQSDLGVAFVAERSLDVVIGVNPEYPIPQDSHLRLHSTEQQKSPAYAGLLGQRFTGAARRCLADERWCAYIMPMPPMSPMPPMPPPPPIGASSFGSSATMASVVIIRPATEQAFCSA